MDPNKDDKSKKNKVFEETPKPASSLGLEILVLTHKIYLVIYNVVLFMLFMFKKYAYAKYTYPQIIGEVIGAIILIFINIIRLRLTSIGNKTEKAHILLIALVFGVINLIGYIYFMYLQRYITYYDLIFSIVGLCLVAAEIVLSFVAIFSIKVHEKNM